MKKLYLFLFLNTDSEVAANLEDDKTKVVHGICVLVIYPFPITKIQQKNETTKFFYTFL